MSVDVESPLDAPVFEASNGAKVSPSLLGGVQITYPDGSISLLSDVAWAALREYAQHVRDADLGRWRWSENADMVVYPEVDGLHRVVDEGTGLAASRNGVNILADSDEFQRAAMAYRSTAVARPWHSAEEGDVWALTVDGRERAYTVEKSPRVTTLYGFVLIDPQNYQAIATVMGTTASAITAGRRIWPEATS